MADFGKRLPWASDDGPEPEFEISDEQWLILESKLSSTISYDARVEIIEICHRYLFSVRGELNAALERDVKRVANIVEKKIDKFANFAHQAGVASFSYGVARTDAEMEFEYRFDDWLRRRIIRLSLHNLQLPESSPPNISEWLEKNNIGLKLSPDLVSRIATELNVAVSQAGERRHSADEIPESTGFIPGRAFKSLMVEICDWAKRHNLPRSLFELDEAGYLPNMLYELHKMLPSEYQKTAVKNQNALAQQMKVAKAE